ncbi:MAG: transcriptional regulator, partial [Chloroflexota bacterium]
MERQARVHQRSVGETAALLLIEKLKEEEFPFIEFRPTIVGRQAFVEGTSLAVWEVAAVARAFDGDSRRVATHLDWPVEKVQDAMA